MAKTKKKNTYLPLVITGYTLFTLLVVATLLSTTIPFGILLFNPKVLHFNVVVTLVGLTVGAFLPVLLGYIIGGNAIKSKSKLSHHFTAVLFGLLAYWVMIVVSALMTIPAAFSEANRNASLMIVNIVPSIAVALIAAVLSVAHVRGQYAKQDIIEYKPFSVLLVVFVVALPTWSLIQNAVTNSITIYSFIPIIIVAVMGLVAYVTLRRAKRTGYNKAIWSAISVSVAFVALFVVPQLVVAISNYLLRTPTMETQALVEWLSVGLALIGWGIYWVTQVRALR